ncbi:MAG: SUMF1/EgtB/PvdO family nonheme iron enzyme, partial [Thermoguttaceae bacterium]|nr:SUMF1/EgtB/PvdO family nonheme iron enzyme [Thermoguttaceae bacterium]
MTPLEAVGAYVPGVGGQVLSYVNHGVNIVTGREGVVEGVLGIVGVSVGGVAGNVLGQINSGIRTARNVGMIGSDFNSRYLYYGEVKQRQWHVRDDQGNEVSVDAKEWKLSYTDGEAKFVLVLEDGKEQEYPIEGLYHEDDLKYLCEYIVNKLDKETPQNEIADSQNHGKEIQTIKARLDSIASKEDKAEAATELKVFFTYLNDELCSVSIATMPIIAGTEAGQEKTLTIRGERYTFRWCPAGSFTRTTVVETTDYETTKDRYRRTVRRPVKKSTLVKQQVTLSRGFWLLDSEVTRQEFDRVVQMRVGGKLPNPQQPATGVTWNSADDFCKQLNTITKKTFRLPTEAEWEYACRAGSSNEETEPAKISEVAWYAENSRSSETPESNGYNNRYYRYNNRYGRRGASATVAHDVKEKKANAWGLYDMQGNVWEWCSDWYGEYSNADVTDPQGPATGQYRVARGGSYMSKAEECQPGYRNRQVSQSTRSQYRQNTDYRVVSFGLRVVLVPDTEETDGNVSENLPNDPQPSVGITADDNAPDETSSAESENVAEDENTDGFTEEEEAEENQDLAEETSEENADEVVESDQDVSDAAEDENTDGFTEEAEENQDVAEETSEENADEVVESDQDVSDAAEDENTDGFTEEAEENQDVAEETSEENADEVVESDQDVSDAAEDENTDGFTEEAEENQ